ncbi:restriction endonuclease subunit S [Pantoea septica]|uniref:restriction endonuclease subunit S n=1 Tax=Pantoea septica TaxID=472695 RepID=UPI00053448D2|nr:restriction endonuclease subunit S [Pantoea septica]
MSELSYLEKLLDGVEVEWRTLGSVADIGTGSSNRQDESEDGAYPFYVRSKNILKSDTFEFDETAIIIPGEGGIGDIFHYVEGKYALHQRAYRIHIKSGGLNTKFLYYFMSSRFKQYILMKSVGATAISIRKPMLEGFQILIPCLDNPEKSLAIQSEIVRILDKFTALTAELTAELIARKKQYSYYRDQLLSFKEGEVEWKMLGEIAEINTGQKPSVTLELPTEFDYINAGTTRSGYTKLSNCEGDTVTTPSRGQGGIGYVGYQKDRFWLGPLCYKMRAVNKEVLINKYLYYFLQSESGLLLGLKKEGGVPAVNKSDLAKLQIPIPSINKQKMIVSILDTFHALTNSVTEGLPREIELRQKQYEYYRDLMFSFPKSIIKGSS